MREQFKLEVERLIASLYDYCKRGLADCYQIDQYTNLILEKYDSLLVPPKEVELTPKDIERAISSVPEGKQYLTVIVRLIADAATAKATLYYQTNNSKVPPTAERQI